MTVPYGEGTEANGGCDDCWRVPSRHCCMWNDRGDLAPVARRLYEQAKARAKRRAEAVQALRTKENP